MPQRCQLIHEAVRYRGRRVAARVARPDPRPTGPAPLSPVPLSEDIGRQVDSGLLAPIAAAWGVVSGTLLPAQGLRLRRFARTWQVSGPPRQDP
jgi:hypothetical protein